MTDQQDRPTKHGLQPPANDGAPRPKLPKELQEGISQSGSKERPTVPRPSRNPPSQKVTPRAHPPEMFSGFNQTPEMLAAEDAAIEQTVLRRGELHGLRKAAKLVCPSCRQGYRMTYNDVNGWQHWPKWQEWQHCNASPIHDEITKLEGERAKAIKMDSTPSDRPNFYYQAMQDGRMMMECPLCGGTGLRAESNICSHCQGSGQVPAHQPSAEADMRNRIEAVRPIVPCSGCTAMNWAWDSPRNRWKCGTCQQDAGEQQGLLCLACTGNGHVGRIECGECNGTGRAERTDDVEGGTQ